eukprot:1198339-Lingulodinium_polyedra.AAC.1
MRVAELPAVLRLAIVREFAGSKCEVCSRGLSTREPEAVFASVRTGGKKGAGVHPGHPASGGG